MKLKCHQTSLPLVCCCNCSWFVHHAP